MSPRSRVPHFDFFFFGLLSFFSDCLSAFFVANAIDRSSSKASIDSDFFLSRGCGVLPVIKRASVLACSRMTRPALAF
jgi:hypothetical protein